MGVVCVNVLICRCWDDSVLEIGRLVMGSFRVKRDNYWAMIIRPNFSTVQLESDGTHKVRLLGLHACVHLSAHGC